MPRSGTMRAARAVAMALGLVLVAPAAHARPLDLTELYELEQHLHCAFTTCATACDAVRATDGTGTTYADVVGCERCLADEACGQPPRIWEKDGVAPVTWNDHDLAVLEQLQPNLICYGDPDETIVLPLELCAGPGCESRLDACLADPDGGCTTTPAAVDCRDEAFGRVCWYDDVPQAGCPDFICTATDSQLARYASETEALCADLDGDGLPAWSEAELAGGLNATPISCTSSADCPSGMVCAEHDNDTLVCQSTRCDLANPCGFFETCVDSGRGALPICVARDQCTLDGTGTGTPGDGPIGETCDPDSGACVACIFDRDCGADARCASGSCLAAERCTSSLDCDDNLVCDSASGYCVGCVSEAECGDGEICTADGACAASCASDLECTGAGQLCHPSLGRCTECVESDTCEFGDVCVLGQCRPSECTDGTRCIVADQSTDPAEASCTAELDCRREGTAGGCTAFHLEKVAEDDVEVLVHVHYDFSPVPARVLDLYLNYDDTQLLLEDARPLTPLALNGKELASSHLSDGTLVLNVFDTGGTHPVPNGPIVELVFRRVGVCPTEIAFTDRAELREVSVAPLQGTTAIQKQLGDDRLWGDAITLCARSEVTPRLRLWYGFESDDEPLAYSNVPSAEDLCAVVPACTFEEDPEFKARLMTRLADLQTGEVLASDRVPGVTRDAVYFDGASDHLRAPIHFEQPLTAAAQSFSLSTWFYSEGNSPNELSTTPQLLYSHNAANERTAFGLMAVETGNDTIGLVLFQGDLLDPRLAGDAVLANAQRLEVGTCAEVDPVVAPGVHWVAQDIPIRTWHQVGFTLDADYDAGGAEDDARIDLYWDGEPVGCVVVPQPPDAVQCPQLALGTDVALHDEGDVLGGSPPEFVYMAVNRSNLYKIERMDPAGLTSTTVIGDSEFSYRDPHYSPILDRLVYSSNVSGDWEIWIARGDGTERRQLTVGFGDEFRGITARRPRWAPDGSAIVFDSNIFDVIADDNAFAFVRHIYFIGYDPIANVVAIELSDNSTTEQLDYLARLADQTIADYRLTSALNKQHRNARWLTGARDDDPSRARGALLIDTSDADFGRHRVQLLTIPEAIPLAGTAAVAGLGVADEIRMIDAFRAEKAAFPRPIVTERLLVQRENTLWEPDDQFTLQCDGETCGGGQSAAEVELIHAPSGYDERCWDANFNAVADASEDRNGDGSWDTADCTPAAMDIYVSYDASRYEPVLDVVSRCTADRDCDGGQVCDTATEICQLATVEAAQCAANSHCDAGEICDGTCKGVVTTVLGCVTEGDCNGLGGTCYKGQCFDEGPVQVACLAPADCPGARGCTDQRCNVSSGLGGLRACAATDDCDAGQRCELGHCKILGRIDETGAVNQIRPCLVHEDCVGGQICGDGSCQATTGISSCASGGDDDCEGGAVCADDICVAAAGAAPFALDGDSCDVHSDCVGGEICDFAAGVCKDAAGPRIMSEQGEAIFGVFGKKVKLATRFTTVGGRATSLVRVQVLTPQSAAPIGAGGIITLRFKERGSSASGSFTPQVFAVRSHVELAVKDLRSAGLPQLFEPAGTFESIVDGAFSPDGDQLLLGAISAARPILLRTRDLTSALDAERVVVSPIRAGGLDWVRQARFYPCNWSGGYVHLQSKTVMYGWRGGLDDFKIHAGLRDPDAFRSEAERGREFLVQNGQDGVVDSRLPGCGNSHVECPPFHLCIESECQMVPCAPDDPWSCASFGGRCTLRPESIEQENPNTDGSTALWDWVCAADCATDNQCFTEQCLNGPCRFCDTGTLTCLECRESVRQLGAISISGIEGCPDRRSFACEAGACVSDCYAFEDGQSIYLCDPTTEYCDAGRCVLLDWDWWDIAPASFAGLGAQRRVVPPDPANAWNGYTQAVDQRVPIEITAYGVEDWNRSPEMLVEVRGGPFYGSEWHSLGKITVRHRTMVQARTSRYTITSPSPFNDMRMRLVTSPVGNPTGGATGLRENDATFCVAALLANVPGATDAVAGATCSALAQGSRYLVGYPVGLPDNDAIAFCQDQGHAGCPTASQGEHDFLQAGQPAVAVLDVIVDGGGAMNNITANKVCGYDGGLLPVDNGAAKKLTYGPFGRERSNQAAALRASCLPSEVPSDFIGLWTADGRASAEGEADDGVAHLLSYTAGRVGEGFAFDGPADYLSPKPSVIRGGGDGFSVESWIKTGDLRGGLVSIFSRPESCQAWKDAGRTEDASYTIWSGGRPVTVHCAGMSDAGVDAREYISLDGAAPGANTSRYLAGGGSFGTPVETTYTKVRFDPVTSTIDIGDQAFAVDNGGRLGDGCLPADRADATASGCFVAVGHLEHLWRGENDTRDTASSVAGRSVGVTFERGPIGQALSFDGRRDRIVSGEGLPADARGLTVEGWIKTGHPGAQTIVRQATDVTVGGWEVGIDATAGTLRFDLVGGLTDSGEASAVVGSVPVADGEWHYIAVTLDAVTGEARARIWVDGTLDAEVIEAEPWDIPDVALAANLVVAQGRNGARPFVGAMDDLGVWSRALDLDDLLRVDSAVLGRIYAAGLAGGVAGHGDGKCLPDEVTDLPLCAAEDIVTTLPLGVAAGCMGTGHRATATLDLTGTPFEVTGELKDVFSKSGRANVAEFSRTEQRWTVEAGGRCGYAGPTGWSGDPAAAPAPTMALPVQFKEDAVGLPSPCDADCRTRIVDELAALSLTPEGLELRVADRVHQARKAGVRLADHAWHHVAVIRAADRVTVAVDGEIWLATTDVPFLTSAAADRVDRVVIGQDGACAATPETCTDKRAAFSGVLDEIAVYDRALSMDEITTIVDAGAEGRPVGGRPGPTCPDDDDGLLEFDRDLYGMALLNCNYYSPLPSQPSASIDFQNIVISREWPARRGAIRFDNGDTCIFELDAVRTEPCYAWTGNDVSIDPGNDAVDIGSYVPFQTLEFGLFRGFGHDEGFEGLAVPRSTLSLTISGLPLDGLVDIGWTPSRGSGSTKLANGTFDLANLAPNRRFEVHVAEDPPGYVCGLVEDPATDAMDTCGNCISGLMPEADLNVGVYCEPRFDVTVVVDTVLSDLVVDASVRSAAGGTVATERLIGSELLTTPRMFGRLKPTAGQHVTASVASPAGYVCTIVEVGDTDASDDTSAVLVRAVTGDVDLAVSCVTAPTFELELEVDDLATVNSPFDCDASPATGLELTDAATGVTLCVDRDGTYTLTGANYAAGAGWDLSVTRQPTGPPYLVCDVTSNGAGVMPDRSADATADFPVELLPRVVCVAPTNVVAAQILGLKGQVEIALIGVGTGAGGADETLATQTHVAPAGTPSGASVDVTFDEAPLEDAIPFRIEVVQQPDGQECTVTPTQATTPLPDGVAVLVSCIDETAPTYSIGGSIVGLTGDQLRIALNLGVVKIDVRADTTSFVFEYESADLAEYSVSIDRQPVGQRCTVANGEGIIDGANIDDVVVTCVNTTIFEITVQGQVGARVKALLLAGGPEAYLAGKEDGGPQSPRLDTGVATFQMPDPDGGFPPLVAGRTYELIVWLSPFVDPATDGPIYPPFLATAATLEITVPTQPAPTTAVTVSAGLFSATAPGQVFAFSTVDATIAKDKPVICVWSPPSTPAPRVPFTAGDARIVGRSVFLCEDDDGCDINDDDGLSTHINEALPAGDLLAVTCWADLDASNTLTRGDLWGQAPAAATSVPATVIMGERQ